MGCFYQNHDYQCDGKNCKGCKNASNYHGEYGKRIYMTDEEIKDTCNDCSCFFECFPDGEIDLDRAKECYNIMFSCCDEDKPENSNSNNACLNAPINTDRAKEFMEHFGCTSCPFANSGVCKAWIDKFGGGSEAVCGDVLTAFLTNQI